MIVISQWKLDHKVEPIPASIVTVGLHTSQFELFVLVTTLDKYLQMSQTLRTHSGLIVVVVIIIFIFCQLLFIILIIRVK